MVGQDRSRYLQSAIETDLTEKMVFLAGPRQVGKTTLARQILASDDRGLYLSWDRDADRRAIRRAEWPAGGGLVVLDELHKYRPWKRWLKGEYDLHREHLRFLVTGSARLDVYRRGGDSLQGRYHHYRLHPFSVAELVESSMEPGLVPGAELVIPSEGSRAAGEALAALLTYGGFPEPLPRAGAARKASI